MTYQEAVRHIHQLMDDKIEFLFKDKQPESLYQAMLYPIEAGGKRIRPLMLAFSCQAVGGALDVCLDVALAVELLHTFTLVHDDIMDHDALRRGRPTVHVKWDEPTAILAGDGLVTLAFQSLSQTNHPHLKEILQIFTNGLLELCEGQAMDKAFEVQSSVKLDEYLEMIDKKTARLIEVSCRIGAVIGNGSDEEQEAIRKYACNLGWAFQIQDDLLDLISNESVSGKPIGSDLREKKKTILTILFENRASDIQRNQFLKLWKQNSLSNEEIHEIRTLFEETGVIGETQNRINALLNEASKALNTLQPSDHRNHLNAMILHLKDRVA
ncbi:polyprenyl synthetase family protein [candidate division KSB1 bacterium]|nr:polyprenyl synthetase family protein [candidate division KSB1 bacterium]